MAGPAVLGHLLLEAQKQIIELEVIVDDAGLVDPLKYSDHLLSKVVNVIPREIEILLKKHLLKRFTESLHDKISIKIFDLNLGITFPLLIPLDLVTIINTWIILRSSMSFPPPIPAPLLPLPLALILD